MLDKEFSKSLRLLKDASALSYPELSDRELIYINFHDRLEALLEELERHLHKIKENKDV